MFILRYLLNIFFTCSKIWRTSLPPLLNPHLLICSTKVRFLVHCTLFISLRNFPNALCVVSGTSLHTFVEKGIREDQEKLFQLFSKKAAVLTQFRTGLFGAAHDWGERPPLSKFCQTYPAIMKLATRIPYLKKIQKMYKSHDIALEFCWHQHFFFSKTG